MTVAWLRLSACFLLLAAALNANPVAAQPATADAPAAEATDGLIEFTSEEGRFSVRLPKEPAHEKTMISETTEQHQFVVEAENGAYLISYQDNPHLEGSGAEELQQALAKGQRGLEETFQGKVLESEKLTLDQEHPGLSIRMTIPDAGGEARCVLYLVGTRLYQILVIGVPAFAGSDEATRVIESFQLVK